MNEQSVLGCFPPARVARAHGLCQTDSVCYTFHMTMRVVWAMTEPTGEFGEITRGAEGTATERTEDPDGTPRIWIEWDAGTATNSEEWMTDKI